MEDARRQEIQSQLQQQDQEIEYDMSQLEETEKQIRQIEVSSDDLVINYAVVACFDGVHGALYTPRRWGANGTWGKTMDPIVTACNDCFVYIPW